MHTARLDLIPHTPDHFLALIEGEEAYAERSGLRPAEGLRDFAVSPDISPEFLARLRAGVPPDPWKDGFALIERASQTVIGLCGFKGPPDPVGTVEIAYGVVPSRQNLGYATEAARAVIAHAFTHPEVQLVCAHTLAEPSASTRVLTKCGFTHAGEVIDPEDGPVWRWEKKREA
jgi:[ribosomal protein S5]-alanine N-acetyltransferase